MIGFPAGTADRQSLVGCLCSAAGDKCASYGAAGQARGGVLSGARSPEPAVSPRCETSSIVAAPVRGAMQLKSFSCRSWFAPRRGAHLPGPRSVKLALPNRTLRHPRYAKDTGPEFTISALKNIII